MSSVVYCRFRVKVKASAGGIAFLKNKFEAGFDGDLGVRAAPLEMCKSDVFAVQQSCNSLSLTINGSTINYRPSEILRDLVISQVHKDAIGKLGQPVFDFSNHGFGTKGSAGSALNRADNKHRLEDPGYAYGLAELSQ